MMAWEKRQSESEENLAMVQAAFQTDPRVPRQLCAALCNHVDTDTMRSTIEGVLNWNQKEKERVTYEWQIKPEPKLDQSIRSTFKERLQLIWSRF